MRVMRRINIRVGKMEARADDRPRPADRPPHRRIPVARTFYLIRPLGSVFSPIRRFGLLRSEPPGE